MNKWVSEWVLMSERASEGVNGWMGIFQKCSERDNFLNIFKWKLSSPYVLQSGALFVDHFPRSSRETAETETLLRRPRTATLPKKTQGFAHLNSRVPDLLHFPTTWWWWWLWWCSWHDDVVDIMVTWLWLTWWWECCPWQSSATRKFSNQTSFDKSIVHGLCLITPRRKSSYRTMTATTGTITAKFTESPFLNWR